MKALQGVQLKKVTATSSTSLDQESENQKDLAKMLQEFMAKRHFLLQDSDSEDKNGDSDSEWSEDDCP